MSAGREAEETVRVPVFDAWAVVPLREYRESYVPQGGPPPWITEPEEA